MWREKGGVCRYVEEGRRGHRDVKEGGRAFKGAEEGRRGCRDVEKGGRGLRGVEGKREVGGMGLRCGRKRRNWFMESGGMEGRRGGRAEAGMEESA